MRGAFSETSSSVVMQCVSCMLIVSVQQTIAKIVMELVRMGRHVVIDLMISGYCFSPRKPSLTMSGRES